MIVADSGAGFGPRPLGRGGIPVSPIGLGVWQFGSGLGFVGASYWSPVSDVEARSIVFESLAGGITWFDTAEAYGRGASERRLSRALTALGRRPGEVVIADKWMPLLRTAGNIPKTFPRRREALAPFGVDLYQVHQPIALSPVAAQMKAMAGLVRRGQIRAVGVSNFDLRRMRAARRALAAEGLPLASNQVRYSLLDRRIETDGILDDALAEGTAVIAYSPLAQGLLSGRFHPGGTAPPRRPTGIRRRLAAFGRRGLQRSRPVVDALREIAAARDATPAQVALNWLITARGEGVVAIPGASSSGQARQNAAALAFRLSAAEVETLDRVSAPFRETR